MAGERMLIRMTIVATAENGDRRATREGGVFCRPGHRQFLPTTPTRNIRCSVFHFFRAMEFIEAPFVSGLGPFAGKHGFPCNGPAKPSSKILGEGKQREREGKKIGECTPQAF